MAEPYPKKKRSIAEDWLDVTNHMPEDINTSSEVVPPGKTCEEWFFETLGSVQDFNSYPIFIKRSVLENMT